MFEQKRSETGAMSKRVVLVGHCGADSAYLRHAITNVAKEIAVVGADDEESLSRLLNDGVDLLLINRILDYGFATDKGVDLIRQLRDQYPDLKMMLVSNYPDAQQAAMRAGALPGFGKRQIGKSQVAEVLRHALGEHD
jgi:two-component system, chemotaxis family, chemotaxis protein CheY